MGFKELCELAAKAGLAPRAGLARNTGPAVVVSASAIRLGAEARLNRLGDVVDELLRQREPFTRLHPRLLEFRAGTVTEHMRRRVQLGEASVVRAGKTTNRKHMCPTEWVGRLYEQD